MLGTVHPTDTVHPSSTPPSPPALPAFPVPACDSPVGARLLKYWRNWVFIGAEDWVIKVLADGYLLPLEGDVPLTSIPPVLGYHHTHPKFYELAAQLLVLIDKHAVEEVCDGSPGFYSRLFLVPKKNGEWRPVIDLSALNQYMSPPHFQMETLRSIIKATPLDRWATSIDLKDAFFHIPVAPRHRRYLRFTVAGRTYQFRALPFGLGMSPYVFTRVMRAVGSYARSQGLLLFLYLDDWLLLSKSSKEGVAWIDWLLKLVQALGLLPNIPKCDLVPSQIYLFIGVLFNLITGMAQPAPHRVQAFLHLLQHFSRLSTPPASVWRQVLGHMTSLEGLVHRGRIHMRPFQYSLRAQWQQYTDSPYILIYPSEHVAPALEWWSAPGRLTQGVPIISAPPDLRLFTDASTVGWGAHLDDLQTSGLWSLNESQLHINNLELLTVLLSLRTFQSAVQGHHVLVMTDNTTVVGQIKNQGGTHSWDLFLLTRELFEWTDSHEITLTAQHIPGRLNVLADRLSRQHQILPAEWSLHPQVALRMWRLWGRPHLDLFATADNAKLPLFVSPYPDPTAWDTDALSLSWRGMWLYAFPPFALLPEVLEKVQSEPCDMILVAPAWPAQAWFHQLLHLSVDHPRRLPNMDRLLKQPDMDVFHDRAHCLHLHAWLLSSRQCEPRVSLRKWLGASQHPTDPLPRRPTTVTGGLSVDGAGLEDGILSLPLPL